MLELAGADGALGSDGDDADWIVGGLVGSVGAGGYFSPPPLCAVVMIGSGDDVKDRVTGEGADFVGANVRDADTTGSAVVDSSSAGIEIVVVLVAKTPPGCVFTALAAAIAVVE